MELRRPDKLLNESILSSDGCSNSSCLVTFDSLQNVASNVFINILLSMSDKWKTSTIFTSDVIRKCKLNEYYVSSIVYMGYF